ncbi:MAG: type III pantothenate kinase, partial [Candidatus Omnitrophica bacterium]|nr:type III pantothenate kinase [Candidatus Omnitrophota bacterium]
SGKRIVRRYSLPSGAGTYCSLLKKICARHNVQEAIVCSVVPKATALLAKELQLILGCKPIIIGRDCKVPIKNRYRKPALVGQDRLVNAFAGVKLYGQPLIVIDCGTAVTFDILSAQGAYEGGVILPGLQLSLDALFERTALLPSVSVSKPRELIGRDTKSSMLSGAVFGFASLIDHMVIRLNKEIGVRARVILTGGNADLMGEYCKRIDVKDSDLTLKGIQLMYSQFKSKVS